MSERFPALRRHHQALIAAGVCAVLIVAFWIRAQAAVRKKSSTYDEPMHALAAWVHAQQGDWRINFEDPPLWHYWAALPHGADALKIDYSSPNWRAMADEWTREWFFTYEVLYRTPPNNGEAFVQSSRSMMMIVAVALAGALAWWGYRLGGLVAGVSATVLLTLDPNFLAHGPLIKNDISMALVMTGLCFAVWRMGVRLTPFNLAAAAVACAAAMATKFSGVLLAPLFAGALLAIRALLPWPWRVWNFAIPRWWQRLLIGAGCGVPAALLSVAVVWASYGFAFAAMPNGNARLNVLTTLQNDCIYAAQAAHNGSIEQEDYRKTVLGFIRWYIDVFPENRGQYSKEYQDMAAAAEPWHPPMSTRGLVWLYKKQLMPEAWVHGLLFVQARSHIRSSYLDEATSPVGFASYFPLAMAYKTPLATIAAAIFAAGVGGFVVVAAYRARRGRPMTVAETPSPVVSEQSPLLANLWLAAVLLLPVAIYLAISIRTNLNIGFRHVLPIYPLIFLAIAWAISAAVARWRWIAVSVAGVLAIGLSIESIAISPDYLTFFNAAAGGQRGGLKRLGDSNLDWGQDLPALAAWQQRPENSNVPLYLSYFGMADPAAYGIRYINMPGGYEMNAQALAPSADSVVAISATKLQRIYIDASLKPLYQTYYIRPPSEVLGGSIYIFDPRKK